VEDQNQIRKIYALLVFRERKFEKRGGDPAGVMKIREINIAALIGWPPFCASDSTAFF